jgi:hypothetical protein
VVGGVGGFGAGVSGAGGFVGGVAGLSGDGLLGSGVVGGVGVGGGVGVDGFCGACIAIGPGIGLNANIGALDIAANASNVSAPCAILICLLACIGFEPPGATNWIGRPLQLRCNPKQKR